MVQVRTMGTRKMPGEEQNTRGRGVLQLTLDSFRILLVRRRDWKSIHMEGFGIADIWEPQKNQ